MHDMILTCQDTQRLGAILSHEGFWPHAAEDPLVIL